MLLILKLQWSDSIMYAVDIIGQMGCTQYASTLEDAHKIGQRGGIFYIITYVGESNG